MKMRLRWSNGKGPCGNYNTKLVHDFGRKDNDKNRYRRKKIAPAKREKKIPYCGNNHGGPKHNRHCGDEQIVNRKAGCSWSGRLYADDIQRYGDQRSNRGGDENISRILTKLAV